MSEKLIVQFTSNTPLAISRAEYDPILDEVLLPGANLEDLFEEREDLHFQLEEFVRAIMSEFLVNGYPNVVIVSNNKE